MIDLTPLDVRNKRGDFKKLLRGYDPQDVDIFLELVAERLEAVVRDNLRLRERSELLQQQVNSQSGREHAVQEALVTAQELRADIREQAQRESDHILHEATTEARRLAAESEAEARTLLRDTERRLEQASDALEEMERRRTRFLKAFRQLLERELDGVEVEEVRAPLEDRPIDLDLGGGRATDVEEPTEGEHDALPGEVPAVDESAEERPPLDESIDELAEAYDQAAGSATGEETSTSDASADDGMVPASDREDDLFLALGSEDPDDDCSG